MYRKDAFELLLTPSLGSVQGEKKNTHAASYTPASSQADVLIKPRNCRDGVFISPDMMNGILTTMHVAATLALKVISSWCSLRPQALKQALSVPNP